MSNRRTLLLITQSQLARIDVAGGKSPRAKGVWIRDRIPGESIATLCDAAIRLGPKKTGDVWVFSNEFWTGVVHLASDVAGALDADELDQAIALEAETYSGISAFESRLGLKSLPKDISGEARWWVSQIPQDDWHDVDQVVRQFRGKLSGIGHAALAAFPTSALNDDGQSDRQRWRLNQSFGEATISIHGVGDAISDVITLGDLKTQRTQTQLIEWCDETAGPGQSLAWVSDQPLPEFLVDTSKVQLSLTADKAGASESAQGQIFGEEAFRVWAETMVASIQSQGNRGVGIPVAVAGKTPMSSQTATLVACALGLLLALGCFAIHSATNKQLTGLNSQIDRFNRTKKALASDTKSLKDLEKELSERREALDEMRIRNRELSTNLSEAGRIRKFQQTRWLKLVSALAKASEGTCWVRGLESRGNVVTVQGIGVSNQDISIFATNLEKYASPHGWRVHPAQTERNEMALVDFEVNLDIWDHEGPDPQAGSSMARSKPNLSFVTAPADSAGAKDSQ